MAEKQQGAVISFGTDGGTYKATQIGSLSAPIPVLDETHLETTGDREKCPGDLADNEPVTVTIQSDGDHAELTKGLVQTITVTAPLGSYTTAENWAGTGFITNITSPEFGSDTEAIATRQVTFVFDGKTGPTRTLAT